MDRRRMEISLGLLVLVALGILAYIAMQMGQLKGLGSLVRAEVIFDNANGLVEGASIKVAGVQVGRVDTLQVDFDKAKATLLIDEAAEIRQDARVAIRARSLLGEKYVEITPQSRTAPVIVNGTRLEAAPGGVELDQLVGELGPLVQDIDLKQVGPLLNELQGLAADARAPLTRTIHRIDEMVGRLETIKFDDPAVQADIRSLIHNLRVSSEKLPGMVDRADKTITELSERSGPLIERLDKTVAKLDPTLERLPGTLDQLSTMTTDLERLLSKLEPMLARADTIDYTVFKKLLREEGLLVRFAPQPVPWKGDAEQSGGGGSGTPPAPDSEQRARAPGSTAPLTVGSSSTPHGQGEASAPAR